MKIYYEDIATILLIFGMGLTITNNVGDVYFESDWFTFIGDSGIFIILLAVILFLQFNKRRRKKAVEF
jgi:xanthine/uracil permease